MAYRDFRHLPRTIISDKLLRDKAFYIANNSQYNEYRRFVSMVCKFLIIKSKGKGVVRRAGVALSNQELADEPIFKKFKKK